MEITEEMKENLLKLYDVGPSSDNEDMAFGIQHGIEETLDILGIKINGINDYNR